MILHADLDAFYAAVAQRDDPRLRGKPIVVAGSSRRAIVLTASYEARPYGIRSAMPLYRAKELCPDLIVAPPQYETYRAISSTLFAILSRHSACVERLAFDEAFADLSDASLEDAVAIATTIKRDVVEATALTASVGIASGKMIAKIASDDGKPDGLVSVAPGTEAEYMADKPIERLWGVGPKTAGRLRSHGIERIDDIARMADERLFELFGKWGKELRDLARGIDRRRVVQGEEWRSVSSEQTFEHDVVDPAALANAARDEARDVANRLQRHGLCAYTLAVKVKFADFTIAGRQTTLTQPTDDSRIIAAAAAFCLKRMDVAGKPVRLVGVRAASLIAKPPKQTSLFGAGQGPW